MSVRGRRDSAGKKGWLIGLIVGILFTVVMVLASGFMVETTNTDTFCAGCHVMVPFRASWRESVHGGRNPQGVTAQCVDCHLPHGNFVQYLVTKAITGTGDVIANLSIDGRTFDWAANAEKNRQHFTYDSACRACHQNLTPAGLPRGGLIAHRSYLRGDADRMCTTCHPHVGHKDMLATAERFFSSSN